MQSIRWTKQTVNIPLRQLAHSMMDQSLSRETQSNLSKDHQEAVWAFAQKRRPNSTGPEHHSSMPPRFRRDPRLFCRMEPYAGQPETVKLNATFAVGWKC